MGDTLGCNAGKVLHSGITTLYPSWNPDVDDEFRFTVTQNGNDYWDIYDEDYENDPIGITRPYLENPDFDICNWYLAHHHTPHRATEAPDNSDNLLQEHLRPLITQAVIALPQECIPCLR